MTAKQRMHLKTNCEICKSEEHNSGHSYIKKSRDTVSWEKNSCFAFVLQGKSFIVAALMQLGVVSWLKAKKRTLHPLKLSKFTGNLVCIVVFLVQVLSAK